MRSKNDIEVEIKLLKLLKPCGAFKHRTKIMIDLAIEELETGVDDTAEEWYELSDGEQDVVNTTRLWKQGDSNDRPSEGWSNLVDTGDSNV
jgi:hypothetical protein